MSQVSVCDHRLRRTHVGFTRVIWLCFVDTFYLVSELMSGGELFDQIVRRVRVPGWVCVCACMRARVCVCVCA